MGVPSLKQAREMAAVAQNRDTCTIGCQKCHKPLWKVQLGDPYGTRQAAIKTPYEGVAPYSEYWTKDQQPLRTDCPFCGEGYCSAVQLPDGKYAAVPTVLEWL